VTDRGERPGAFGRVAAAGLTLACWAGAAALALALVARALRGWAWELDLVATFAAPIAAAGAVGAGAALGARRWAAGVVALVAVAAHGAWSLGGRAPVGGGPGERAVRVMAFNYYGLNADPARFLEALGASDPDVVVVQEAPMSLVEAIRGDAALAARYPHRALPAPGSWWNRIKLSRWPLEPVPVGDPSVAAERSSYALWRTDLVRHPGRPFLLAAMLPLSPRTAPDWRVGNEEAVAEARWIRERLAPMGHPVVVAADLNATPTGARTREVFRAGGLRRAKPAGVAAGTWPAGLPAWGRVAIDDTLVSAGVRVADWRTAEAPTGSDHVPVVVELLLPPRASEEATDGS
jgi:endonuclease/exonuclease/phosphatase (EEP) superfamily protein YafD